MISNYNYEKMFSLTEELLAILMNGNLSSDDLALFAEKVNASEDFFSGMAADAFRKSAREALGSFSLSDNKSLLRLITVAQMPRNNAEAMQITDKITANKIRNMFVGI